MKTILSDEHERTMILRALADKSPAGSITGFSSSSLSQLLATESTPLHLFILSFSHLLKEEKSKFPVYQKMFSYPVFLNEILVFAKTCILYNIQPDDLPSDNISDRELKEMIRLALQLSFPEKQLNTDAVLRTLENDSFILYPMFTSDVYRYRFFKQLQLLKNTETITFQHTPEVSVRFALNLSQEAESVVQDIIRRGESANILLTSASQLSAVKDVLRRYGVPFACVIDRKEVHIPRVYASLLRLGVQKDVSSYLDALKANAFSVQCPPAAYTFAKGRIKDILSPICLSEEIAGSVYAEYAKSIQKAESLYNAFLKEVKDDLSRLLEAKTTDDILQVSFQIMQKSPYLSFTEEKDQAIRLRSDIIRTHAGLLNEDDLLMYAELIENTSVSCTDVNTDFCVISDLRHPVLPKQNTYILNCSGRNYPGFHGRTGIFDEAYVSKIRKFPSLKERHDMYHEQLNWIFSSAEKNLFFSYSTNDYEGREIELSFDIENTFHLKPGKWELVRTNAAGRKRKNLSPLVSKQLFTKNDIIHGSVSSIENYFQCPFKYFVQSGLKIRKSELPGLDAASIGTAQHAFMEHLFHMPDEELLTREYIAEFLSPYFDTISKIDPAHTAFVRMCKARMEDSLWNTVRIFNALNAASHFRQAEAEWHFEETIAEGIRLHGTVDRIDLFQNYLRIIDYKSSEKTLPEKEIKAGLKLQLLSYLITACQQFQKEPSGVYYFSLKDTTFNDCAWSVVSSRKKAEPKELIENIADEESDFDQMIKDRRMHGMTFLNFPREFLDGVFITPAKAEFDFPLITACIKELYAYFRETLLDGIIQASPVEGACQFCDYDPICLYRGPKGKPEPRVMKDVPLKKKKEGKK